MGDTNFCTDNLLISVGKLRNFVIYKFCVAIALSVFAIGIFESDTSIVRAAEITSSENSKGGEQQKTREQLKPEEQPKPADVEVRSINEALRSPEHWRGADGAMSLELSKTKTLWLFGDTWIYCDMGKGGQPKQMVNNSVAVQNSDCEAESAAVGSLESICIDSMCWSFWCKGNLSRPESIFTASEPNSYYWPGCGTVYDGKLYLLLKKIRRKEDPDPLFQFDWYADDLVIVSNPQDPPKSWHYSITPVSDADHDVQFGLACTKDKEYFYSLCFLREFPKTKKKTILSRISWSDVLANKTNNWQFWSHTDKSLEGAWGDDFRKAKNIIPDCGPEASLFFHKGLNCFVTVYQPPLSPEVKLRVAKKIEGPWSESLKIFTVPERVLKSGKTALSYAGKAHESLSSGNTIGFSYCENPGGLEEHADNPEVYFPTVRTYTIAPEKVREMLDGAGVSTPKP